MLKAVKVLDGVYNVGRTQVVRDGRRWFLVGHEEKFNSFKVAVIAARAFEGDDLSDAEYTALKENK